MSFLLRYFMIYYDKPPYRNGFYRGERGRFLKEEHNDGQ